MSKENKKTNPDGEQEELFKEEDLNNIPIPKGMQAIREFAKDKTFDEDKIESILDSLITDTTIKYIDVNLLEKSPKDWNFFKPLDPSKFLILKKSIKSEGLLHPIHVWNYKDRFIILSGHNRVKAFKELYEETNNDVYKKIPAKINKVDELNKDKARMIVAIGNTQRAVTLIEEYETIKRFFDYNKNYRGIDSYLENYAEIEKATGKKLRTIQKAINLNALIPELLNMIGNKKPSISTKTGEILSKFSESDQKFLYDEFRYDLSYNLVRKISPDMKREEIRNIFKKYLKIKNIKKKKLSYTVPEEIEEKVKEKFEDIIKEEISKWEEEHGIKWKI